jgi:hypothetical protein
MKLYFNGILMDTRVADILEPIDWTTSDNIYINRSYTNTPTDTTHYHRVAVIDRILTDKEIVEIYDEREGIVEPEPEPEPAPEPEIPLDSFLLFDANFNNTLLSDVGSVDFRGDVQLHSGYVTISPDNHLQATGKIIPSFLNNTGDQSWVVNFKALTQFDATLFVQTTLRHFSENTGFSIRIYNSFLQARLHYAKNEILVDCFIDIGNLHLSAVVHSIVVTYSQAGDVFGPHLMNMYINAGTPDIMNSNLPDESIDWSTSDGIYLNKSHVHTPHGETEFHQVSIYDRVLTDEEVQTIYDKRADHLRVDPNLVFDINFNNSMIADVGGGEFVGQSVVYNELLTIAGGNYVELQDGMPEFLKSENEQSWHVVFRSDTETGNKLFIQNTKITSDCEMSVNQRTGFYLVISGTFIQAIFFKG